MEIVSGSLLSLYSKLQYRSNKYSANKTTPFAVYNVSLLLLKYCIQQNKNMVLISPEDEGKPTCPTTGLNSSFNQN